MIYLFNFLGELLNTFSSRKEAAEKTGIEYETIKAAIRRKSIIQSKFYFQEDDKVWRKPTKKINMNPMDWKRY